MTTRGALADHQRPRRYHLNQETAGFIQAIKPTRTTTSVTPTPTRRLTGTPAPAPVHHDQSATGQRQPAHDHALSARQRDGVHDALLPWKPVEENGHSSLGLRAAVYTDLDRWKWVNGIDLDYTDGWLKETQAEPFSPNQPAGIHYDYQVDATVAAIYSQATFDPTSNWELTLGARFETTRYDYNNRTGDGPACAPEATACRFYRPADRGRRFQQLVHSRWHQLLPARGYRGLSQGRPGLPGTTGERVVPAAGEPVRGRPRLRGDSQYRTGVSRHSREHFPILDFRVLHGKG